MHHFLIIPPLGLCGIMEIQMQTVCCCTSFPKITSRNVTLVTSNWSCWEYLDFGNWQMLQIRTGFIILSIYRFKKMFKMQIKSMSCM